MHPPKKPVPFALRHWFALLMCLLLLLTLAKVIEMLTVGLPGLLFGIPTLLLLVALLILLPMLRSRARSLPACAGGFRPMPRMPRARWAPTA